MVTKPDAPPEPLAAPPRPDAPPKRGRGRSAGSSPRASTRSLETEIGAALVQANLPLMVFAPRDALDEAEVVALARALDAQAKRSVTFRKYVQRALEITSGGELLTVGAMIMARRAARHGMLRVVGVPDATAQFVDAQLGDALRSIAKVAEPAPAYAPAPPEASESAPSNGASGPITITPDMMRPAPPAPDAPNADAGAA